MLRYPVSFRVESFGCRASQADGDAIAAELERHGGRARGQLQAASQADVLIVNTCAVTAEAEATARARIRRAHRENPATRIVVTGCYAQRAPAELRELSGVAAVIGNSHKALVPRVAAVLGGVATEPPGLDLSAAGFQGLLQGASGFVPLSALAAPARVPGERALLLHRDYGFSANPFRDMEAIHFDSATLPLDGPAQRTRPSLRVQDGCSNRCSFCIIPSTRGPSRSVPLDRVLEAARGFTGVEMVLSGIHLGRWGRDLAPAATLAGLVEALLTQTSLPRLRISSVEPMDWSDELLRLFDRYAHGDTPRLARHIHLPLQSGSDAILRRMHRRYRPWHYAARVHAIAERVPGAAIGADVMVGFPGETDVLFQESYEFIAGLPLTYLHLFPFSARPGTTAHELARREPVDGRVVRERMAVLQALAAEKARVFRASQVGEVLSAVTLAGGMEGASDSPGDGGRAAEALSDNFLRLSLPAGLPANRLVRARVLEGRGQQPDLPPRLTAHGPPLASELAG